MTNTLSMIMVFACLWLGLVTATPVKYAVDPVLDDPMSNDQSKSTDFVAGTPLTEEELNGDFSDIGTESSEEFIQWDKQDPSLHEGDIMGDKNAILDSSHRWPNARIPYVISAGYTTEQRSVIAFAMNEYHKYTCIVFVPRTSEKNYIRILKTGKGCSSFIGMINTGAQDVSLDDGCIGRSFPGIVLHELMHAAGFFHEHNRPDRDSFVRIIFPNILPQHVNNFIKNNVTQVTTFGLPYDYDSVMHYPKDAFAIDRNKPTIIPIPNENVAIGQRVRFNWLDLLKLNTLYCSEVG